MTRDELNAIVAAAATRRDAKKEAADAEYRDEVAVATERFLSTPSATKPKPAVRPRPKRQPAPGRKKWNIGDALPVRLPRSKSGKRLGRNALTTWGPRLLHREYANGDGPGKIFTRPLLKSAMGAQWPDDKISRQSVDNLLVKCETEGWVHKVEDQHRDTWEPQKFEWVAGAQPP